MDFCFAFVTCSSEQRPALSQSLLVLHQGHDAEAGAVTEPSQL